MRYGRINQRLLMSKWQKKKAVDDPFTAQLFDSETFIPFYFQFYTSTVIKYQLYLFYALVSGRLLKHHLATNYTMGT